VKVIYNIPPKLHNIEMPFEPVVITVNDFTEESAMSGQTLQRRTCVGSSRSMAMHDAPSS